MIWILAIVVIILLWLVLAYNGLVQSRTRTQEAYSDIDVQFKRRYDLIPNLVSTVQGYAAHEKTVFEDVTNARSQRCRRPVRQRRMQRTSFRERSNRSLPLRKIIRTLRRIRTS